MSGLWCYCGCLYCAVQYHAVLCSASSPQVTPQNDRANSNFLQSKLSSIASFTDKRRLALSWPVMQWILTSSFTFSTTTSHYSKHESLSSVSLTSHPSVSTSKWPDKSPKRVRCSLCGTNPPWLKEIVPGRRPLTHLWLTSKIPHTR